MKHRNLRHSEVTSTSSLIKGIKEDIYIHNNKNIYIYIYMQLYARKEFPLREAS